MAEEQHAYRVPAVLVVSAFVLIAVAGVIFAALQSGEAESPARLAMARYRPPAASGSPLMLLCKGITFDTGGINVKPYEAFVSTMKNDMGGAALAFSLFRALVESGHPEPVMLVLPTCENAIGPAAMRPGTFVKSYRGSPSASITPTPRVAWFSPTPSPMRATSKRRNKCFP